MKKISLAFSGGGCSIIYYSRLARILYEKGYELDALSASSSGCFIAMPLAAGYTPIEVEMLLKKHYATYNKLIFRPKWHNAYGLFTNRNIGDVMQAVCEEKGVYCISDFPTPIIIQSVNARTGEVVYFSNLDIPGKKVIKHASVKEAIMASTAFPGLYKGITVKDDNGNPLLLTDGGLRGNVAVGVLKRCVNSEVWACSYEKNDVPTPAKHFPGIALRLIISALNDLQERELSAADKVLKIKRSSSSVLDLKVKRFDEMEKSGEAQLLRLLD